MSDDVEVQRAAALLDLGRYDEARVALGRSLARTPDDLTALELMTRAHYGAGHYRDAVATAGRVLAQLPGDGMALRIAARSHSALGEHALASDAAWAAVRADPASPDSHIALAEVGIAQPSVAAGALEAAETAVRIAPWASGTHVTLGNVQRKLRQPAKARASYEQALRIDPQSLAARNNLALLGLDRGRATSTARTLTGLLRQNPQDAGAARNLLVAVAVAMRNIRLALIVPYLVLAVVDFRSFDSEPAYAPTARLIAAVLALAIGVGYSAFVLRHGGSGLRRFVAGLLRTDRLFVGCVALLAVTVALFVVAPVVDFAAGGGGLLYTGSIIAGNYLTRHWTRTRTRAIR